jgi:hypothetical protein
MKGSAPVIYFFFKKKTDAVKLLLLKKTDAVKLLLLGRALRW